MLTTVLTYLNDSCPKCGGILLTNRAKQLAQCPLCHPYGQRPIALLMQTGLTFVEAEEKLNSLDAARQSAQGVPAPDGNIAERVFYAR